MLDLSHTPAVGAGVCEFGGKRRGQKDWQKSANLVSVRGFDITISFEKYSLELFVKVGVRL